MEVQQRSADTERKSVDHTHAKDSSPGPVVLEMELPPASDM